MLRRLLNLVLRSPQTPVPVDPTMDRVVLYARLGDTSFERTGHVPAPVPVVRPTLPARVNHRVRLLSMRLEHTRLCGPHRCERLRQLGIVTAGDLAAANPDVLAQRFMAKRKAASVLKQYRRAIRLAAAVPGMMPLDALLLISIHRRSVRGLASEKPSMLHRDLERFAESSRGRVQLRGRRIPSTRRLRRWISECESLTLRYPMQARAA